jgi:endonuclease/exonuclease/phosphatase family metal-dependent hydrolase
LAGNPAVAGEIVRIVSWNMKWFPGGSPEATEQERKAQMAAGQAEIKALNPDILLLQEIADYSAAKQLVSVLDGFKVDISSNFPSRPQNVVIASRFPADSAWSEAWKKTGIDDPPRGFAFAAIQLPDKRLLLTYSLHLKSNLGDADEDIGMREEAIRQLLPHAKAMIDLYSKRAPVVLVIGGDFNTSLDSPKFKNENTLRALKQAGLKWAHEGIPPANRVSIPGSSGYPPDTFDHIFYSGIGSPLAKVPQVAGVSDHNPVILDFDLDTRTVVTLASEKAKLPVATVTPIVIRRPSSGSVVHANDTAKLRTLVGKKTTVSGTVSSVARVGMGSIALINFEGSQKGDFVGLVKGEDIREIGLKNGGSLNQLKGRAIEVTGTVIDYKGTSEIAITDSSQIRVTR